MFREGIIPFRNARHSCAPAAGRKVRAPRVRLRWEPAASQVACQTRTAPEVDKRVAAIPAIVAAPALTRWPGTSSRCLFRRDIHVRPSGTPAALSGDLEGD